MKLIMQQVLQPALVAHLTNIKRFAPTEPRDKRPREAELPDTPVYCIVPPVRALSWKRLSIRTARALADNTR